MTKMGISTLQSYRGAQIFEAIGLEPRRSSTTTSLDRRRASRASGSTSIAEESQRAARLTPSRRRRALDGELDVGGQYQWRRRGEHHM